MYILVAGREFRSGVGMREEDREREEIENNAKLFLSVVRMSVLSGQMLINQGRTGCELPVCIPPVLKFRFSGTGQSQDALTRTDLYYVVARSIVDALSTLPQERRVY